MNIKRARRDCGRIRPAALLLFILVLGLGSAACVTGPGSEPTNGTASATATHTTLVITAAPTSTARVTDETTALPLLAATATPTEEPATEKPATKEPATPEPTVEKTAAAVSLSVKISSLPALVKPGANVTMTAITSPGAKCSAGVTYASGHLSTAKGLVPEPVAGASGKVSWTWLVGTSTGAGTSTATVTCSLGDDSASASEHFEVS
jgi:hypothetical protein